MLNTIPAVIREGKIELLENVSLTEGTRVLVTILTDDDERHFWMRVTQPAMAAIWDNAEDDVYAELLKK